MSNYFFSTHIIARSLVIRCSFDMPLHFLSGHDSPNTRLVFHYNYCPPRYLGKFAWPPHGRNKSALSEHQAFLSSVELLHYNKLQHCCSRQQTPLVHTQGTFASHRVTQFHHASPSPLFSPPRIDGFFSLNVCQSVNSLTWLHPIPVTSIAEFFYAKQIITRKLLRLACTLKFCRLCFTDHPVDKITAMQQCQKAIWILMPAYFCQPVTPMYQVSIIHWPDWMTKTRGWNCQVLSASRYTSRHVPRTPLWRWTWLGGGLAKE